MSMNISMLCDAKIIDYSVNNAHTYSISRAWFKLATDTTDHSFTNKEYDAQK